MNQLYYGRRLHFYSQTGLLLEIIIVIGSGASGVSGWIIWTTYPSLKAIWAGIAAAATPFAALKPTLRIDRKIKQYSSLFSAYRQLSVSMGMIVERIAESQRVEPEADREIARVRARYKDFSSDDDPRPSPKIIKQIQDKVNRLIPVASLFYPHSPQQNQLASDTADGTGRPDPVADLVQQADTVSES